MTPIYDLKNKIILVLASLGLIVCSYMFYTYKLVNFSYDNHGELSGILLTSSGLVKRKNEEEYIWYSLKNKQKIYWGDSVFTGNKSTGIIRLSQNSTDILLTENTNIVLTKEKSQININLKKGNIKAELANGSEIGIKGISLKPIILKGTSKGKTDIIIKKVNNKANISVIKGEAEFVSNKEKIKISQKTSLNVDLKSPQVEKMLVPILLKEPSFGSIHWASEDIKNQMTFNWSSDPKEEKNDQIIIAKDLAFSQIVETSKNQELDQSYTSSTLDSSHKYYWKVVNKFKESKIFEFQLNKNSKIIFPKGIISSYMVSRSKLDQGITLNLDWEDSSVAEKYEMLLSRVEDSRDIKKYSFVSTKSTHFKLNQYGEYHFQVRAIRTQQIKSRWSEKLIIKVIEKEKLKAPIIESQFINNKIKGFLKGLMGLLIDHAIAEDQLIIKKKNEKVLKWQLVDGAIGYQVLISKSESFSDSEQIIKNDIEKNEYTYQFTSVGNYYWKVAAYDSEGELGEWSLPQLIIIKPEIKVPDVKLSEKTKPIQKKIKKKKKKVIIKKDIAQNKNNDKNKNKEIKKTEYRYEVKAGIGLLQSKIKQSTSNEETNVQNYEQSGTSFSTFSLSGHYKNKNDFCVFDLLSSQFVLKSEAGNDIKGSRLKWGLGYKKKIIFLFNLEVEIGLQQKPRFLITEENGTNAELITFNQFYLYQKIFLPRINFSERNSIKLGAELAELLSPFFKELTFGVSIDVRRTYKTFKIFSEISYEIQKRPLILRNSINQQVGTAEISNNFLSIVFGIVKGF